MSNEPIFEKLAREYDLRGKSYERMVTPYLSPVMSLGTKQPLIHAPVYGPDPHLDGPFKEPLPKRNLAQLIQIPEPDSEFTRKMQEFVETAPMQILVKTPAGSFVQTFKSACIEEDNTITLEAEEVIIPTGDQREREKAMVPPILRSLEEKARRMKGVYPKLEILDEVQRFQEPISYEDLAEEMEKVGNAVVLTKTITTEELIEGKTSVDAIQELGREFAEKHPGAEVLEVNVGEKLNGDVVVTVRGTLISEENDISTTNPEQTDESVNAASNEETDEDNQPVILAPNFWKIRDEE